MYPSPKHDNITFNIETIKVFQAENNDVDICLWIFFEK